MISKKQRANAHRIKLLSDTFGDLRYTANGQTPNKVLDLSIPCAALVCAGVVTGVNPETNDGINDNAVAEVEDKCLLAVAFTEQWHGRGWWSERADALLNARAMS